jgi:hypothetical protein
MPQIQALPSIRQTFTATLHRKSLPVRLACPLRIGSRSICKEPFGPAWRLAGNLQGSNRSGTPEAGQETRTRNSHA